MKSMKQRDGLVQKMNGETWLPLTRREARRPLPLKWGRGGRGWSSLQLNPTIRLPNIAREPHLAPGLGGEVATSLRVAGEGELPTDQPDFPCNAGGRG